MRRLTIGVVSEKNNPEGRWSAEAADLPGTLSFGSPLTAARGAQAKALRALADAIRDGTIEEVFLGRVERALFGGAASVEKTEASLRALADHADPRLCSLQQAPLVLAALRAVFRVVS